MNSLWGTMIPPGRGERRWTGAARGHRTRAAVAAVLVVLPLLALQACQPDKSSASSSGAASSGGQSGGGGGGSASSAATESAATTSSAATPQSTATDTADLSRDAAAFTACVRNHGVSDFPGVTVLSNGTLQLDSSSSFSPLSAAYKAAAKACAYTLPSGALPSDPTPPSIAGPSIGIG